MLEKINRVIKNNNKYVFDRCVVCIPQDDFAFDTLTELCSELEGKTAAAAKEIVRKYSASITSNFGCNDLVRKQALNYLLGFINCALN
ncbi:unnamed protein product [Sphagnum jensenii]